MGQRFIEQINRSPTFLYRGVWHIGKVAVFQQVGAVMLDPSFILRHPQRRAGQI